MAKVTFMNSILSGKLGGLVYAFNKAGNYVRTFRKGTDPATTAMLNNQARFAGAATSWHALDDPDKSAWNAFSISDFKPKNGVPGVRFSGINAFMSLATVVRNMHDKQGTFTPVAPGASVATVIDYVFDQNPPVNPLSASIKDAGGLPLDISISNVYITLSSSLSFDINFGRSVAVGTGTTGPNFVDATGSVPVGLAFVASLPITQEQGFVPNPDINLIAVTPPIGQLEDWTAGAVLNATCTFTTEFTTRKYTYQNGDIVQVKAYLIGKNGMTQPLNAVKTTVVN